MSEEEERRRADEKDLFLGRDKVTLHVVERMAGGRDAHAECA